MKHKVVLLGFPGAGKSTVGAALRDVYGWMWVDVDAEIERTVGCSIAQLIREEGEEHFRKLEKQAVKNAIEGEASVVSLGGGALLDPESRKLVEDCVTVHLSVSAEEAARRVEHDERLAVARGETEQRPLLSGRQSEGTTLDRVKSLMEKRRGVYEVARHTISVENASPNEIASEIVSIVSLYP